MISKEEVEHIAKLARLELTKKEVEKMQEDLSEILGYFDLLKKAPKAGRSAEGVRGSLNAVRLDESKLRDAGLVEKLIKAAPDKKDGYIKVKTIL
jgi:aspartyl-tRNA(Asn)/glutamyl-tRNA(Gln) amidotransferase subunit C